VIIIINRAENGVSLEFKDEGEQGLLVYNTSADEGGLNAEAVRDFIYDILELLGIREDKGRYSREVIRTYVEVGDKYEPTEDEEIYEETIYKVRRKK